MTLTFVVAILGKCGHFFFLCIRRWYPFLEEVKDFEDNFNGALCFCRQPYGFNMIKHWNIYWRCQFQGKHDFLESNHDKAKKHQFISFVWSDIKLSIFDRQDLMLIMLEDKLYRTIRLLPPWRIATSTRCYIFMLVSYSTGYAGGYYFFLGYYM